jgi:copper homeostasis protein
MLRENTGYAITPQESGTLRGTAIALADAGVDGLVVGFATDAGAPALDDLRGVLSAAPGARATFHRAFDALTDQLGTIDALLDITQVDRILTSGGEGSPAARCVRLRTFADRAGARFRIIAGGGVTAAMLPAIVGARCVTEVHVGRAARDGIDPDGPVLSESVRRLRDLADAALR